MLTPSQKKALRKEYSETACVCCKMILDDLERHGGALKDRTWADGTPQFPVEGKIRHADRLLPSKKPTPF